MNSMKQVSTINAEMIGNRLLGFNWEDMTYDLTVHDFNLVMCCQYKTNS